MKLNSMSESADYSLSFNQFIFDQIPANSTCLDVGCNAGNLGKFLVRNKSCSVDGIDINPKALEGAKKNGYNKTYLINLNDNSFHSKFTNEKYRVIIFSDILEHLINPREILTYFKNYLDSNGQIIISLPNVAFMLYRIQLLFGQWDYREYGTMDKTHLRFFTIKSGIDMVKAAGFEIMKVKPYNQFGILRYIKPLDLIFPSLFAYQFMIVAK